MLVGVDFKQTAILVFDSFKAQGGNVRAKAATEVTF
jgi:hypothetical protein